MKLIDDWKKVLRRAWSLRLILLASALSAAEVVLPLFDDQFRRGTFAVLALVVSIGAAVARVVSQPEMRK